MGIFNSLFGIETINDEKKEYELGDYEETELPSQEEMNSTIEHSENYSYEYVKPRIFETIEGDYTKWWSDFKKEPKLVIIIGSRRKGKSASAYSIGECLAQQSKRMIYSIGTESAELPNFIYNIDNVEDCPNDSILVVGEGGIESNARDSMTKKNIGVSKLMSVISHKGIWVIYVTQSSSKLDITLIRESDVIILFEPSLMMMDMDRAVIKKLYHKYNNYITKYTEQIKGKKGVCILYSKELICTMRWKLPSFWCDSIS